MDSFLTVAERLGIPVGILVFLAIALWAVLKWLGNKVVLPITESHIELVKSAKESNQLNSKTLEAIGGIIQSKAGTLDKISGQNDQILMLVNKNHDLLIELKKQQSED